MAKLRFTVAFALAFGLLSAQDDTRVVTLPAPPGATAGQTAVHAVTNAQQGSVAARSRGFLWKATSGSTTVYLAGSIHFGSPDMYPLPEEMERAFQESSVLVLEVNPNEVSPMKAMSLIASSGTYPFGDSLWNHVSERTRSLLPGFAERYGMNAEMLARMKPWAVDLMLSVQMMQAAGMRPDLGIDKHFLESASGKRVEAIETAEEQLRALTAAPEREQLRALEETVANPEHAQQILQTMKAAWIKGDAATIEALASDEFKNSPVTKKRLLDDRNVGMTAAVEHYLKGGEPCFVVVGAAHLVGSGGIVSRLAASGYKVQRVTSAN